MSKSNVRDTGVLQSLYLEFPRYCGKSVDIIQSFSSILSQKMDYLGSLESHFISRIQAAEAHKRSCEAALDACEWSAAAAAATGSYVDCSGQRAALESARVALARAQDNYARYKSEMACLASTFASYKIAENKYHNSLNTVQNQVSAELNGIIQNLDDYSTLSDTVYQKNRTNIQS